MTKYKSQGFINTFRNARKGMRLSIKSEQNIRVHILCGALALALGFALHFSCVKFCILLLTIVMVISSEMMNSAIEFALDSIYHNRYSKMVGMAKDIAAGAVMIVTVVALMVGVLLFVPPIYKIMLG
ncbi:diacylglycerol kinase family protein [bacterium]|jgi:diacylglycerol kinase|nr:diacylglycerol kinase family protein [bacterium]MBR1620442.1 diacylglycerol kinase family protein [bacterium]